MPSTADTSRTPPSLSPAGPSSSGSSVDISGCMPTPSPRSPGPQRLRGIQWIARLNKPAPPAAVQAAPVAPVETRQSQVPSPPDLALFREPSSPSLAATQGLVASQRDAVDLEVVPTATQGRRLARELFPEDAHLYGTAPPAASIGWGIRQQDTEEEPSEQEDEVDELLSSPSQVPSITPAPQETVRTRVQSEPIHHVKQPTNIQRSYGKVTTAQTRTANWQKFREQLGVDQPEAQASVTKTAITASESNQSVQEAALEEFTSYEGQSPSYCAPTANQSHHAAQAASRQSFRPIKRPRALPSEATTFTEAQDADDADIPVPYPPDIKQEEAIAEQGYSDNYETPARFLQQYPSDKPAYLTRHAARVLQRRTQDQHRMRQKQKLIKYGQSIVHEAIIERPRRAAYEREGHQQLEVGFMVPTPQADEAEAALPVAQIVRRRFKQPIPAKIEETSFGSHLTRPRKRRAVCESSQDTGNDDSPPPSLPKHDYVGPTPPPSPRTKRKPLSELRAGKYAAEQAEERKRAASVPFEELDAHRSRPGKRVKFDPRIAIPKGHSALLIGPLVNKGEAADAPMPVAAGAALKAAKTPAEESRLRRQRLRRKPLEATLIPMQRYANADSSVGTTAALSSEKEHDDLASKGQQSAEYSVAAEMPQQHTLSKPKASAAQSHGHASPSQSVHPRRTKPLKPAHTLINPTSFRFRDPSDSRSSSSVPGRQAILAGASRPFTIASDNSAAIDVDVLAGPSCAFTVEATVVGATASRDKHAVAAPHLALPLAPIKDAAYSNFEGIKDICSAVLQENRLEAVASPAAHGPAPTSSVEKKSRAVLPTVMRSNAPAPRTPLPGPADEQPMPVDHVGELTAETEDASTPPPPAQAPLCTEHISSSSNEHLHSNGQGEQAYAEETDDIVAAQTPSPPLPDSPPSHEPSPETLVTLQSKSKKSYGACHATVIRQSSKLPDGRARYPEPAQKRKRIIDQQTQADVVEETAGTDPFV